MWIPFSSLFSTGVIVLLGATTVQGLFTTTGVLGGNHAPTSHLFVEELYPEMLIYSGEPPKKYSLLQVGNMSGSMDGRKQLDERKPIKKAGSSSAPSKSPGKPVGPMQPWKPDMDKLHKLLFSRSSHCKSKPKPTLPSHIASTFQEPHSSTGSMASLLTEISKTSTRILDTSTTAITSTFHRRSSVPSNVATLKGTRNSQKAGNIMEATSSAPHTFESILSKTTLSNLILNTTEKSIVSALMNTSNSPRNHTHNGAELNSTLQSDTSMTVTRVETNMPEMISTTKHTPNLTEVSFTNSVLVPGTESTNSTSYPSLYQPIKPEETSSEMSTGSPKSITSTEITTSQTRHFVGTPNMVLQGALETSSVSGMLSNVSQSYPLLETSTLLSTSYVAPSKTKSSSLEGIFSELRWGTTVRTNSSSPFNSTSESHSYSFTGSMNLPLPVTHQTTKQDWDTAWIRSGTLKNMDLTTKYDPNHTEVPINISFLKSWTKDISTGNTSLTKLQQSTSEETSRGVTIRTPGSSINTKSQELTNSHTGHSVLTLNRVTSENISTSTSIKDTNSSGVHTFPHSEAMSPSNNIASETLTPVSWEESVSEDSITMAHELHSTSTVSSMIDRHSRLSTSSLASVITISKNLIPTDLSTSSGPVINSILRLSSNSQTSLNIAQVSNISQMTTVSSVTKGNHVEDESSIPQLKHTITTTPVSYENEYFTIVPINSGGTTLSSSQSIPFATVEIGKQIAPTQNTAWKNNSKSEVANTTEGKNTSQTYVSTIPSLQLSQKAAMFEHSTSLSMPHQSKSEDTSIGISTRLLSSTTAPESEETAASHRGQSAMTSNMVTSHSTSTTASNTDTQHSGTQTFLLSESVGHSINSLSPSWDHSSWKRSMSASSIRPTPDVPSHSPVPAIAGRYSTSSPISVTSIFTVAKDPIFSRLLKSSGSVTHSISSSNSDQLSTISQKTSVSSLTPESSMEEGTYTPHAKHIITSVSASPEKESFTTIMSTMQHTRLPPSQPISSESTEIETGTASSWRMVRTDFGTSEDISTTTGHSPSHGRLPTSPSLFESRTGAMSADSTPLSTSHQSTSEDTSTGISTSLPTSAISIETEEMTGRTMGHSLVMTDILTYPDTSSTASAKDTHSSGIHTYPHLEPTAPFNNSASASQTLTSGEGSMSADSTIPGSLSLTPGASLPDRHSSHSPDSAASVYTVAKDPVSKVFSTISGSVTISNPSLSQSLQPNFYTALISKISQTTSASSVTPKYIMEDSNTISQRKYINAPTAVSWENELSATILPSLEEITLPTSQLAPSENSGILTQGTNSLTRAQEKPRTYKEIHSITEEDPNHTKVPSLHESQTAAMFEHSTSLSMPRQSKSEDTSIGISTRLLSSTTTPQSEETAASLRGQSVVTSTTASNTDTQDSRTQTFLLSESVGHSINSTSPSWDHSTWKRSMSASSTRPTPDVPSHSPVPANAGRYSTSSPISVTSVFTAAKDPIFSRLFRTSGPVSHSISSSNSDQLSTISQKTSVSSLTPENSMEEGTYTPHAKHTITSISLPDRHSSHSPHSAASVFTGAKDLFQTASHTSSYPVTAYIPSWTTISQPSSNTTHVSQTSKMNKFSSVTPGSSMKTSSSVRQFKHTIAPTSVSSENKAFSTTIPITQLSTLSPTQPTTFEHEKAGTQNFTLLTTLTQANIHEKMHLSTDSINSHSEVPYNSSLPVSRTVPMSSDNTILSMLQQFTSENTKFTPEDKSSGVVTKVYDSITTKSEEIPTSQTRDSEVTSNMVLSLETSPVSSVSHNITSFAPIPLVPEISTFLSQSYDVPSIATFPTLKGSQPARSPGHLDGSALASPESTGGYYSFYFTGNVF
ncbi:hypothetical protein STEG23_018831 [Scotinomys teguina]